MRLLRPAIAATTLVTLLAFAGCASTPSASGPGSLEPSNPDGDVIAQGTVRGDGSGAELCLGAVAESYPPQCSGIPLAGWSWDAVDGAETASGVTWGAYAVQGAYDGGTITVTEPPVLLALYDPMPLDDPTGGRPGTADDATLQDVQARVHDTLGAGVLTSGTYDGRLWVTVVWDDGTLQQAADAEFGDDVVVVQSALRQVASER